MRIFLYLKKINLYQGGFGLLSASYYHSLRSSLKMSTGILLLLLLLFGPLPLFAAAAAAAVDDISVLGFVVLVFFWFSFKLKKLLLLSREGALITFERSADFFQLIKS